MISLTKNILKYGSIKTTSRRAKVVKPLVEKIISLAKSNTLAAKREAFKTLGEHDLVSKLFSETGPLFAKRTSGFTRLISLGKRRGDNAEIVIFELTERKPKEVKKAKKAKEEKPVEEGQTKQPETPAKETNEEKQQQRAALNKKPAKKFFGGFKNIFKKERDSL
jgi:large subunit ribosomal protein L17